MSEQHDTFVTKLSTMLVGDGKGRWMVLGEADFDVSFGDITVTPSKLSNHTPGLTVKYQEYRQHPVEDSLAADLADAAADYIEKNGWIQFALSDDEGHVCAMGALQHVTGDHFVVETVAHRVATFLDRVSLARFNDDVDRTQQEVVDALRDFALKTRPDAATFTPEDTS